MKKIRRKLLVLALTFMLIVGMLPVSAYAEGEEGYSLSTVVPGGGGTISCNMAVAGGSDITRAKAGDTVTVKAEPNTDYKLAGLYLLPKDDSVPTTLSHQITSDFTQSTANPKCYDFTMPGYDAKVAAVFQKLMTPTPVARTVTYQVKNGTWSDGSAGNKTETVNSGNFPANVPTGMIAATGYKVGAWDSNPSSSPITEDKTFTYTFIEEALVVTHTLTVTADPAEGGTVTDGGEFIAGAQVAAQATANEGHVFDGWYKGSERVGSFDWYIFNLNEDTNLVAKFHKFTSAEVEVDIDAPLCGVETETTGSLPAGGYDGTTQTNRPKGTVKTAGWGEGSFGWDAFFYGWNTAPSAFQGTFEGGETYLVRGSIAPENGTMPDEVKVVVNGTELPSDRVQVINDTGYKAVQFIAQVKAAHDLTHHEKVGATVEQAGMEEYWQCEGCGKYFSDAKGQTEISKPAAIPALKRTSIELNETKLVLHPGDTFTLVPTTTPKGLDVSFTPSNKGVVSVDENGVVTALRLGKDTVTVSTGGDEVYQRSEVVVEIEVVNEAVSVTGSIVWDDGDNIDGRRPANTWLKIRRTDGEPVVDMDGNAVAAEVEIAGTQGTKRSHTWENLPLFKQGTAYAELIEYEVVETGGDGMAWTPGGYEKLASGNKADGFVITNRYIPLQTDIVVNKVWEDDDDAAGKRPESVTLHVDRKPYASTGDDDIKDVAAALTADEAGGWKAAWRGLPYRQKVSGFSTEILYSVREDAVKNYAGRLVQTDVGRRASIVWADGISEEDKPASITATLINETGDATSRTAVLNEANNWTCEFTGLPEHMAAAYTISLFPCLQPELGYLQHAVVWGYTLANTLIPAIELEIDVPQCGTVVNEDHSYPLNQATGEYDPAAQSNRPVGTILTSGWEFVKSTADPTVDWLKWGPFEGWEQNLTMAFPITLTGGSSYNALGRIVPSGGASVPAAFSIVVNEQELPADRFKVDNGIIYFAASIEAVHALVKQDRVEPSCTAAGIEEHWKCTACGKLYSDENGQNEIAEPAAIDKLPHTPGDAVRENEVPASCETEGSYDEVVCCTECKEELSREKKTIDAIGHDWGEWVVTKEATETEEGAETRICTNDASHTETRAIPKTDPEEISYRNTKGNGATWTRGSGETLDFTFKRSVDDGKTFSLFTGIEVDGKAVDEDKYTTDAGSVVVKLSPEYLETLSVGSHTVKALFEDGSARASFTIQWKKNSSNDNNANNNTGSNTNQKTNTGTTTKAATASDKTTTTAPKTGDENNMMRWFIIICASAAVLLIATRRMRLK